MARSSVGFKLDPGTLDGVAGSPRADRQGQAWRQSLRHGRQIGRGFLFETAPGASSTIRT
jgi:hypothetical protein